METIAPSGRKSFQWKSLLLVESIPFQWKPFLVVEAIPFSGTHSLQWKHFTLMETIAPDERHSFQWKPFPLVEAVRFSVKCFLSFQWKPFLQRKPLTFSRNNLFQQKLLLLIDGISFIGSYSFYWKTFILVEAIPFSLLRKAFVFDGNHCPQLKPIFLEEAYSFQWKHGGSCFF